jgi:hypothetical protein
MEPVGYYPAGFIYLEVLMKFSVTYEDGLWTFSLESTDPQSDYYEEFEIMDEDEAKTVAAELIGEISIADDDLDLEEMVANRIDPE